MPDRRIVTLLPAATEILCALGLRDDPVGRSHECDHPADVTAPPVLTRSRLSKGLDSAGINAGVCALIEAGEAIYDIDEATLAGVAPTVVITQEACEVCAVSYEQVAAVAGRAIPDARIVSLGPQRLGDVLGDIERVAQACGIPERGRGEVAALRARLTAVRRPKQRLRVTVVEWLDPPMLAAHWTAETIEAAGGEYVGPGPGEPSRYATWEEIEGLCPDRVLVAPCGYELDRTRADTRRHLNCMRGLSARVLVVDGNAYLNRPGPRLVDAAEAIAGWLGEGDVAASFGEPLETR